MGYNLLNWIIHKVQNGSIDEIISNTIDLSNSAAASISFKYAFAKRNSGNSDYLQILASKDCGETWFMRKNILLL